MDVNEIVNNEEVMEATPEIVEETSGSGFKKVAGVGLTLLAGGLAYKYIAKPIAAKIKAHKESKKIEVVATDLAEEVDEVSPEIEEN